MPKSYSAVYVEKKGLFNSKKYNILISFYEDKVAGSTLKFSGGSDYSYQRFDLSYDDITNYEECTFEDLPCLKIDTRKQYNAKVQYNDSYIFPLYPKNEIKEVIDELEKCLNNVKAANEALIERQNELMRLRKEEEELEQQRIIEMKDFYNNTYAFHIKEQTPTYTIYKEEPNCFTIYIGEDNSLNFLLIEADSKTEIHSVIKYDEIHYYEKAGAVHYATNINASYTGSQSFGGSFVGARASVGATVLGGLLFGTMGMAIGALASYKPAEYTPPTHIPSKFNISSEITKIDERSVILNYYSEQKKQYVDIELPQEIFNFLQTFLPDKKYAIVLAKETQGAVQAPTSEPAEDDTVVRLKKLKELYEMELISETEYTERKKEILAGI